MISLPATKSSDDCRGLMIMVVMGFALTYGHHASVRDFAIHVLKLDCGVVDAEVLVQVVLYIAQDALADGGWNVLDRDMAGKGVGF